MVRLDLIGCPRRSDEERLYRDTTIEIRDTSEIRDKR